MPADKLDFEIAQKIHDLFIDVVTQGSKEDALKCNAMGDLAVLCLTTGTTVREFLFRCAIAVQFGPVEDVPSEGTRQGDAPTWGDDTLSQEDKDTDKRIEALEEAYRLHHDETLGDILPEDKDDPDQGFT